MNIEAKKIKLLREDGTSVELSDAILRKKLVDKLNLQASTESLRSVICVLLNNHELWYEIIHIDNNEILLRWIDLKKEGKYVHAQ